jgi:DNA adenine methylase
MLFDKSKGESKAHVLPRTVFPKSPPLKMQGIKTKIVPLIARSIAWEDKGRWIEPFLGTGVVALNIAPSEAVLADTNEHVINLYRNLRDGEINGRKVRVHLEREGRMLLEKGESHYYAVRERFNETGDPLDFLFLNRSCFNGMMRFNRQGKFNVPFCRKPERFRPALVTKIVNQIEWTSSVMKGKNWRLVVQDWRRTISEATEGDMLYCDPPYVGRHTDYYNGFTDDEADDLARALRSTQAKFAMSMWLENKYRKNDYVERWFTNFPQRTMSHFYHVGPTEKLRNPMTEVVVLSLDAAAPPSHMQNSSPLLFEATEFQ